MPSSNPRYLKPKMRNKLRTQVAREESICWICRKPIDYSLPAHHPYSYELDEIIPVSKGGNPLDRMNVHASHRKCNRWKSNRILAWVDGMLTDVEKQRPVAQITTSHDWLQ